jgi:hypothetical protein
MKLSFSRRNSIGGFLTVTTVAALVLSHLVGGLAKATEESTLATVFTSVQLHSLFEGASRGSLENDCISILHRCREGEILVSSIELPPSPPVPGRAGGSW